MKILGTQMSKLYAYSKRGKYHIDLDRNEIYIELDCACDPLQADKAYKDFINDFWKYDAPLLIETLECRFGGTYEITFDFYDYFNWSCYVQFKIKEVEE